MFIGSLMLMRLTPSVLSLNGKTFFDTWKYQGNSVGAIKESKLDTSPAERSGHFLGILMQKSYNLHLQVPDMSL